MTDANVYRTVLADDVSALRRLIRIAIEKDGKFKVVGEASTGRQAIEETLRTQPDLVLLDLSMPEMDGLEALPKILQAGNRCRVVVLSGFNHVRMAPIALRMGATAYLEKGLEPKKMIQEILAVLEPPVSRKPDPPQSPDALSAQNNKPGSIKQTDDRHRLLLLQNADASNRVPTEALEDREDTRFETVRCDEMDKALQRLRNGSPDLVLVDPSVLGDTPDDGLIELLTAAPATPVIVLVPPSDPGLAERAFKLGVEDCLPLDIDDTGLLTRSILYAIERRRAYESRRQLREQETELERMHRIDAMKAHFFNTAAHELGTPLTPIRLQLHLLKTATEKDRSPMETKALEILERNVDRLSRLTQDLLDVAKIQAGHLRIDKSPVPVSRVVQEVRDSFEPVAEYRGIKLDADCETDGFVDIDQKRIGQVLYNLVDNALKFTPKGGHVLLVCRMDGDRCTAQVKDTGIGLRRDQINRLFRPFSQVLESDQPSGIGSGLGLYVSKGIVELHGGTLWCESEGPGKGSTFTLALPKAETNDNGNVTADAKETTTAATLAKLGQGQTARRP